MKCRSCENVTYPVLSLGQQPLANSLLSLASEPFASFPLKIVYCPSCSLAQIDESVRPDAMFREYLYYSKVQTSLVESARRLVNQTAPLLNEESLVIELASNDGYLLQFYKDKGIPVLGVDPARGPATEAERCGIPTAQDFFTLELAQKLPKADIMHANNVLAHVPDTNDFVAGIAEVLKPTGKIIVEVPYLGNLIESGTFDTVYHEHVFYFSKKSLNILFGRHGLHIENIEHIPAHGGSLRITAGKQKGLEAFFPDSNLLGIDTLQNRTDETARQLLAKFMELKKQGFRVWGWGAAAKATVMMNYCGIQNDLIHAVADDAPAKVGKYIPGTGCPIVTPEEWLDEQPEYTCLFSWNYARELRERYKDTYKGTLFTPYESRIAHVC
jgi:SAM-dependent methyltransferase